MTQPHWTTLISVGALHAQLHSSDLVLMDCRYELNQPDAGHQAYRLAHLPGAHYAHLHHDLSGPVTATSGRHPLPDVKTLSATLGRWGIDADTQVVAYDTDNGAMAAARLWWLLRWLGHDKVAVLDGGIKHWQASGCALSSSSFAPAARIFTAREDATWLADAQLVADSAAHAQWRVLDARAAERYAGEMEPIDPVAGHVPGAINHPFTHNLRGDGRFLPAAVLHDQFTALLGDVAPQQVINMCGSGVTACHNQLAMAVAGLPGARMYAGSWSEWSKQQRPAAIGRKP